MADELLRALGKRQRELDEARPQLSDAVEGEAGEALLDGLFEQLDAEPLRPEPTPAKVTELPRKRSALWAATGVVLAAAAALVLWFASQSPASAPLPPYGVDMVAGGPATVRGERETSEAKLVLTSPSDGIEVQLSTAAPHDREIAVSVLATASDGRTVFSRAPSVVVSASGSVRMRGPLSDFVSLSEGSWMVEIVLAPAEDAPESAEDVVEGDWQRIPFEVIIGAP